MVLNQELNSDLGILQITGGVVNTYKGSSWRNISISDFFMMLLARILLAIFFFPALLIIWFYAAKSQKKAVEAMKIIDNQKLESDADYNNLKQFYQVLKKLDPAPITADLPFFMRMMINMVLPTTNAWLETRRIVEEKLCLRPKGVTDAQLDAVGKKLKENGFYERYSADDFGDDDYYEKAAALGKIKFLDDNALGIKIK